jgi:hypothetical protein
LRCDERLASKGGETFLCKKMHAGGAKTEGEEVIRRNEMRD